MPVAALNMATVDDDMFKWSKSVNKLLPLVPLLLLLLLFELMKW
jgi:hypothetical protein